MVSGSISHGRPGITVPVNSTVTIQVNVGPKKATIPNDLVGKSLTDATKALKDLDFSNVKTKVDTTSTAKANTVLSVDPSGGATVALDTPITITYAPGTGTVPNFFGLDKAAAQVLVFGGDGRLRGAAPGLFGSAVGDHTAPGIAGLALREIPGRDRTTPAGRFIGGYGPSIDAGRVLWVDYESAVSIHPTAIGTPAERRAERLASPTQEDNRVTHGCINVEPGFYEQVVRATFERGGIFYILPDKDSIADTFPDFAQSRVSARADESGESSATAVER